MKENEEIYIESEKEIKEVEVVDTTPEVVTPQVDVQKSFGVVGGTSMEAESVLSTRDKDSFWKAFTSASLSAKQEVADALGARVGDSRRKLQTAHLNYNK